MLSNTKYIFISYLIDYLIIWNIYHETLFNKRCHHCKTFWIYGLKVKLETFLKGSIKSMFEKPFVLWPFKFEFSNSFELRAWYFQINKTWLKYLSSSRLLSHYNIMCHHTLSSLYMHWGILVPDLLAVSRLWRFSGELIAIN